MMLGFWKLKVATGARKYNEWAHMGVVNRFYRPIQFGHFSLLDPPYQQ
jgi:hypothetical protein